MTIKDKEGNSLDGADTYSLHVPANPPVRLYWSATAYDRATHALIRDMKWSSRSSNTPGLQKNADGSMGVYFGPKAPAGKESNWVPTNTGGGFEVLFRLYGPEKPFFEKTWVLVAWILASVLRAVIRKTLTTANVDERLARQAETRRPVSLTQTIADTVYWLVFLLFLPAILNALALQGLMVPVQSMIDEVLRFLPNIFTAGLILAVGWFVARVVRGIVTNFLSAVGADTLSRNVGLAPALGSQSVSALIGLVVYILILVPVVIAALNTMLATLPAIFAATLILVIAYVTGRLVAALVGSLLAGVGFTSILLRLGLARQMSPGQRTPSETVGYLAFIAIMLVAAMEAARQLGFTVLGDLISRFLIFAGDVVLGLIILAIGLYLAGIAYAAVRSSSAAHAGTLAVAAQVSVVVLAGAMALRQMGLADDIINLAFGLILGGVVLAAALAVGLGAREVAGRGVDQLVRSIKARNGVPRPVEAAGDKLVP
jgi:hypothetical protein